MSTTMSFQTAIPRSVPRAAALLGSAFAGVLRVLRLANPVPRYDMHISVEQARAMAAQWAEFDPRSAAELMAAADRYEQAHPRA